MNVTRRGVAVLAAGLLVDGSARAHKPTALVVGYLAAPEFGAIFVER